jgi:cathepsin L
VGALATIGAVKLFTQSMSLTNSKRMLTSESVLDLAWAAWKEKHGKTYGTNTENDFRRKVFEDNYRHIQSVNSDSTKKWKAGLNKFSDLTGAEFKAQWTNKDMLENARPDHGAIEVTLDTSNLADSVNWVTAGAVNPVQDQGHCGGCWAFSAISTIESAHFIKTKSLVKLAEQQCIDCDTRSSGCNGGWQENCYKYAMTDLLRTEEHYPYTGVADSCLSFYPGEFKITGYKKVPAGDVNQLKAAVAIGPVATCIEADQTVFQSYTGGVIQGTDCGTTLDHAVVIEGYGHDEETG